MAIKVYNPLLAHYTNNQRTAEVEGKTIDQCLKNLGEQFPELKLFDTDGKLLAYLCLYINDEIVHPEELDKTVKDGDKLSILFMIDGG